MDLYAVNESNLLPNITMMHICPFRSTKVYRIPLAGQPGESHTPVIKAKERVEAIGDAFGCEKITTNNEDIYVGLDIQYLNIVSFLVVKYGIMCNYS